MSAKFMRNYAGATATATTTQPAAHLLAYAKFALRIRRVWRKVVAALLSMPHANNATASPPPPPLRFFAVLIILWQIHILC